MISLTVIVNIEVNNIKSFRIWHPLCWISHSSYDDVHEMLACVYLVLVYSSTLQEYRTITEEFSLFFEFLLSLFKYFLIDFAITFLIFFFLLFFLYI